MTETPTSRVATPPRSRRTDPVTSARVTSETSTTDEAPLNRRGLIPVWAPLLVMLAVILTGVVLGGIGTSYALLFLISAVVCTALVELRGLFLTVVLLPFFWFFGVTGIGLVSDWDGFTSGDRRVALIQAAWPSVEHFLWLGTAVVLCIIVAVARYQLDAAALSRQDRQRRAQRTKLARAEEANQRLNTRVRDAGSDSGLNAGHDSGRTSGQPVGRTTARHAERAPGHPPSQEAPSRTRSAAELRRASERRNRSSPSQDRPLDLD